MVSWEEKGGGGKIQLRYSLKSVKYFTFLYGGVIQTKQRLGPKYIQLMT